MRAELFVCLLLVVVACFGDEPQNQNPDEEPKEKKYKKYMGEQDYPIPFKTRISEPFKEGHTIHAAGYIVKDPTRINFNFHTGHKDDADMPLHLSIRFDEGIFSGKVIYNTFQSGNWSNEEQRISSPFKGDSPFDLRVRILEGKYQVFGNRKEIGTFDQRLPLEGVDYVSITGSLVRLSVFHYGGAIFPNPYTAIAKLIPGKRLDISALPTGNRVNVNLNRKSSGYALQVSIRYNEGAIVRNAMIDNVWGQEEREGDFQLNKDEIFDLTIINEEFSYQIFVNGQRYCTFAHRGSPTDIETLEIDGNVILHSVTINPV